jgi:hypothetical protein
MVEPLLDDYIKLSWQLGRITFCEKVAVPVLISSTIEEHPTFQEEPTDSKFEMVPELLAMAEADIDLAPHMPVIELRGLSEAKEVMVGRDEGNDIVIHDETVSANHAVFDIKTPGQTHLRDLGSRNGTMVNLEKLESGVAVQLQDGNELSFGNVPYLFFTPGGLYDILKKVFPDMRSGVKPTS